MLRKGQEGHVRAERDVLKGAALVSNPNGAEWIVRLFYSFQDRDHLYLVRTDHSERIVSLEDVHYANRFWNSWAEETYSICLSRRMCLRKISHDSISQRSRLLLLL
jgi:hypothetical protein